MRVLVVYESMDGNTHAVAEGIGSGLRSTADVTVVPVSRVHADDLTAVDLLVVGGPTHVHGVTTARSRAAAITAASGPGVQPSLDPDAEGPGLRDWLDGLDCSGVSRAAAFDTRFDGPAIVTGRASRGIAHRLRGRGLDLLAPPESFLVDRDYHLTPGATDTAVAWGVHLARLLAKVTDAPRTSTSLAHRPDQLPR